MSAGTPRPLALVTGASSGIGLELARQFADHGFDLIITAQDDAIDTVAATLGGGGVQVRAVRSDLATGEGVEQVNAAVTAHARPLTAAALNAGIGRGGGSFVETDLDDHLEVIRLNVLGTVHLTGLILPGMVAANAGRLLITSSIVATMPGPFQATYNASKSFLQSFATGLQNELRDSAVTLTVLMPGITDTPFYPRAGLSDTRIGRLSRKDDPAQVARQGFHALMRGRRRVVAGSPVNRVGVALLSVLPDAAQANLQRLLSRPRR